MKNKMLFIIIMAGLIWVGCTKDQGPLVTTVEGRLLNVNTKMPIADVTFWIKRDYENSEEIIYATTGENGEFSFDAITEDGSALYFSGQVLKQYGAYIRRTAKIRYNGDSLYNLDLTMFYHGTFPLEEGRHHSFEMETSPNPYFEIGWENGGYVFYLDQTGEHGKVCSYYGLGSMGWSEAKTACSNYDGMGYTDWYLPDIQELILLRDNLDTFIIEGVGGTIWSFTNSTALDFLKVQNEEYRYEDPYSVSADYPLQVRAVREF